MIYTGFQTFRDDQLKSIGHLVDMLPVGVFRTTLKGRFVFCNKEFPRIFGFESAEELREHSIASLHRGNKDRGEFFKEITEKGVVKEFNLPFKKKDGIPIWCAITARVVYDEDDVPRFFDGTIQDITDKLKNDREQLKQKKLQGVLEMAGGVLHRLNQPLTIINNLINEVLTEGNREKPNYRNLMKLHEQIIKLNDLAKKIGRIKKYKSMDYVAGIKIVDIDEAS